MACAFWDGGSGGGSRGLGGALVEVGLKAGTEDIEGRGNNCGREAATPVELCQRIDGVELQRQKKGKKLTRRRADAPTDCEPLGDQYMKE